MTKSKIDQTILLRKFMKKHNIIWLHTHFLFWMGGTKFVYQIISELKKKKEIGDIIVIVENASEFSKQQYIKIGVKLISLQSRTSNSSLYWILLPCYLIKNIFLIRKILRKYNLSKKNTTIFSGMFPMNVVATFLKYKHVQNCFEPFAFFYDSQFISQFTLLKRIFILGLKYIYSPLDKWAVKSADTVLTLNEVTKKLVKDVYGVNSFKTQAGVDSELFKPYVSEKISRMYKNKVIAIHSTDYSPIKRTDLVIEAFALAAKRVPHAQLLITTTIEDTEKKSELYALAQSLGIAKKVIFLGFVPISDLPQYYSLAQVLIQGAFSEKSGTTSMSLPVKEALCCETPAIRPNAGGEDVIDGKTGFLVDPRNIKLMAEKIEYLLSHKIVAKKMGAQARKDIAKKYTWKNTTQVFLNQL